MMSFVETVMNPHLLATVLAAVCVFATVLSVAMPMLQRDRMNTRMREMATERDKMRNARIAEMTAKDRQGGKLRQAPRGFMQKIVDVLDLREKFDNEAMREKLKMAGLRGQGPIVSFMFFRIAAPIFMFIATLVYVFFIGEFSYPPLIKFLMGCRRRLPRLLPADRVHRKPGAKASVVDQAVVPRRARHAFDLRAVGHVD